MNHSNLTSPTDGPSNPGGYSVGVPQGGLSPSQQRTPASARSFPSAPGTPGRKRPRISRRDILSLTVQLSIMTRAGVDLASALESIAKQCRTATLKKTLEELHHDVSEGVSISEALRRRSGAFGSTYVASVSAGEASGQLVEVLEQLAEVQRSDLKLLGTIKTVLAYPILLASVSSLVLFGLVFFVLPQFRDIFQEFDTPLPAITRALLYVASEARARPWLWGAMAAAAVGGLLMMTRTDTGRRGWDHFTVKAWILGDVTRALLIGRSFRLMGVMLQSGVPLLETLRIVRESIHNRLFRDVFVAVENDVVNGRGIGNRLLATEVVPDAAAEMIATAEQTGSLGMVTELVGQHFEEEGETLLRGFVALLEPAIIVFMGTIVAVVVLAVMLPMFDMATLGGG